MTQRLPTCLICLIVKHYTPLSDRSKYLRLSKKFNRLLKIKPSDIRNPDLIERAMRLGTPQIIRMFLDKFPYDLDMLYIYCLKYGKNKILRYIDEDFHSNYCYEIKNIEWLITDWKFSKSKIRFIYSNIHDFKCFTINMDTVIYNYMYYLRDEDIPNFIRFTYDTGNGIAVSKRICSSVLQHGDFKTLSIVPMRWILDYVTRDRAIAYALCNARDKYRTHLLYKLGEPYDKKYVLGKVKCNYVGLTNYIEHIQIPPNPYVLLDEIREKLTKKIVYRVNSTEDVLKHEGAKCFRLIQNQIYSMTGDKKSLHYQWENLRYDIEIAYDNLYCCNGGEICRTCRFAV
jgi:hypothetical protein